ncbi:MAG: glycosyltransferase family 4 protein [Bacteroidia bacterium]|nr:glycosyltransferase family 4 protein [Bacteroidia bacterium]
MKILFVVEHYYPYIGGAEELWKSLTTALVKEGHEVTVATTRYDKKLPISETIDGVKVVRVDVANRYFFTFFSFPAINKLAKGVDVIHTASYNSAIPAWLVAKFQGKRTIITFHEVWGKLWFKLPFTSKFVLSAYYLFEQLILRLPFSYFVAVSNATAERLSQSGIRRDKIKVIHNGLNYDMFENYRHDPGKRLVICYFGRLGISKGIEILLEAIAEFFQGNKEAVFRFIIPTYPERVYKQVLSLIEDLNIKDRIEMLHDLPKSVLLEKVSSASCVVVPSHSEGFCYTAAETVAMEVPIISSDKGSLKEVVSGKFIKLKELNIQELVDAFRKAENGEWQESNERRFEMSDTIANYLKLYSEIR